ncbi:MAG TPA: peptidoglycan DD-metalloendopeptidase family protein [Candidatus Dorea intestinavium]|nr:peptidoglycan DD-metalloendopeptidase family protein [Candidatus Dorea intestinavium]
MGRGKRSVAIFLALLLSFAMIMPIGATDISSEEQKAKEIEEQKQNAENEEAQISANLNKILDEMVEIRNSIAKKMDEIQAKEVELAAAKAQVDDQYEAMKLRIRFMYESGNTQFIEVLVKSKNFSDLINNAEYVQMVSSYDRNMLTQFQDIVTEVERQEKELKAEHEQLENMQVELQAKQASVETMLASKSQEVKELGAALAQQNEKVAQMKEAAAEAARIAAERAAAAAASTPVYGTGGASLISGNGQFAHPNPVGRISCGFGYRTHPIFGGSDFHKGLDLASPTGTPIYAADAGTVTTAGYGPSTGNWIVINHGNGLLTYYMHASALFVRSGEQVSRGQNIAAVGSTGDSTGPHLHFQVMLNGTAVNPALYL